MPSSQRFYYLELGYSNISEQCMGRDMQDSEEVAGKELIQKLHGEETPELLTIL